MKIISSTVVMASQHELVEKDVEEQSLRTWNNAGSNGTSPGNGVEEFVKKAKQDSAEISEQAQELYRIHTQAMEKVSSGQTPKISDKDKQKLLLIQAMLESFTGKKVRFYELEEETAQDNASVRTQNNIPMGFNSNASSNNLVGGAGMEYHSYRAHSEQEQTSFQAAGMVRTADGKDINFAVKMNMSRQFLSEQRVDIRAGTALKDPLVINFDSPSVQLTNNKFQFDIDSDGNQEEMSFVKEGSGFLAIDLNNDGIVNNGKELFGPGSGNGFQELAQYDSDGNQWIDENDPIYENLRIWTKDDNGKDQLFALGQKGIGAIYLGNVNTEFAIKDTALQLQGQIRQTGIFLKEDGGVGTVQHVDLAI